MNLTEINERINMLIEQSNKLHAELEDLRDKRSGLERELRTDMHEVNITAHDPDGKVEDYIIALIDKYHEDPTSRKKCIAQLRNYRWYQETTEEERKAHFEKAFERLRKLTVDIYEDEDAD